MKTFITPAFSVINYQIINNDYEIVNGSFVISLTDGKSIALPWEYPIFQWEKVNNLEFKHLLFHSNTLISELKNVVSLFFVIWIECGTYRVHSRLKLAPYYYFIRDMWDNTFIYSDVIKDMSGNKIHWKKDVQRNIFVRYGFLRYSWYYP